MFSKRPNSEGGSEPSPLSSVPNEIVRKGPRVASLITDEMRIEGNLSGDGELQIDGFVRGDVKIAKLTIGEHGRVEGSVTSETLECRGKVVGSIVAREVRLYASSHVDGDITHDELSIEAGAYFQGRAVRLQKNVTPQAVSSPVLVGEVLPASVA